MIKNEMPVEVMELSPRAINGLLSNNVLTMGDLQTLRYRDVLCGLQNVGLNTAIEIIDMLAKRKILLHSSDKPLPNVLKSGYCVMTKISV